MKKMIHFLRYMLNKEYKKNYNNKKRFAHIMMVNKSIIEQL